MTREEELEICARIKEARKQAGYTQENFAELLHVIPRSVQNYEHDRVPWRHLRKIAKLTNVTEEWLLHGEKAQQASDLAELVDEVRALREEMRVALRDLALSRGVRSAQEAGQEKAGKRPAARGKREPKKKSPASG